MSVLYPRAVKAQVQDELRVNLSRVRLCRILEAEANLAASAAHLAALRSALREAEQEGEAPSDDVPYTRIPE